MSRAKKPTPRPYQTLGLEKLSQLRTKGNRRALAVLASGLGKTYLAAFDAVAFQKERSGKIRLLYLSHQHVILEQAVSTYRRLFSNAVTFGRFDGEQKDYQADFLFATFQSMQGHLSSFPQDFFNYIVVDEAHHTAAPTRDAVVNYFMPDFLLGLTATPNRSDGKDIYDYYNDTVAVSLPLERALAEDLLTPIDYRVLSDVDDPKLLREILREKGSISPSHLFKPRLDSDIVATVKRQARKMFSHPKIIVFCASLAQMDHFAKLFGDARTISGRNDRDEQISILSAFTAGEFPVLLARDVLNEGVDIPDANTLVFLRNTESPVVFLQQLGRGLRKAENKSQMLVLDFVSNLDRFYYVYSLFTRLHAEERAHRAAGPAEGRVVSSLDLDETAHKVIERLIHRKEESGIVVELKALTKGLSYKVNARTLKKMIDKGLLIPDFDYTDMRGKKSFYFEQSTVRRFFRQVHSPAATERYIHERNFAKALNKDVHWIHRQEKFAYAQPSWIHERTNGVVEFFFTEDDLAEWRLLC